MVPCIQNRRSRFFKTAAIVFFFIPLLLACEPTGPLWLNGGKVETFNPKGRWLVVNYWAVWCKPCITEIPELNHLAAQHPQLQMLGVNFDQVDRALLAQQIDKLNIQFPVLVSSPTQLNLVKPQVLPTTYIIDPEGRQVARLLGPQTLASLQRALAEAGWQ